MGLGLDIGIGDCGYKLLFKIWIGDRDCGSRPGIVIRDWDWSWSDRFSLPGKVYFAI